MPQTELLDRIPVQAWETTPESIRTLLLSLLPLETEVSELRARLQPSEDAPSELSHSSPVQPQTDRIKRYQTLVDKRFLKRLDSAETAELERLGAQTDADNAPFYESIYERLQTALSLRTSKTCVLALLALFVLVGCNDKETPVPATSVQPQVATPISSMAKHSQTPAQKDKLTINLSKLWGASKKQVERTLRGHKLIDHNYTEKDNPDKMIAGGEGRTYSFGDGAELNVYFNSQGYAVAVFVDNQKEDGSGLGFTLDHWQDGFRRYGLPICGEPAKTAPLAYYWGPPHNRTGGFEIKLFANEKGQVWQVQVRSPDDFFPE